VRGERGIYIPLQVPKALLYLVTDPLSNRKSPDGQSDPSH